jgi:hypothetical protein
MSGMVETDDGSKFQVRGSKFSEPRAPNFELRLSRIAVAEACGERTH